MMDIRAIRDEADYDWALAQIEPYFDNEPELGTEAADRFDVLATLIEAYEAERYELPAADPVTVLQFAIDHLGRSQAELAQILGSRSRASEILHRQRLLTLDMIRTIAEAWKLPIAALTSVYELERSTA